jgi:hypothetical protein
MTAAAPSAALCAQTIVSHGTAQNSASVREPHDTMADRSLAMVTASPAPTSPA